MPFLLDEYTGDAGQTLDNNDDKTSKHWIICLTVDSPVYYTLNPNTKNTLVVPIIDVDKGFMQGDTVLKRSFPASSLKFLIT